MKETYQRGESIAQIAQCLADAVGRNLTCHTLLGTLDADEEKRIFVAPCKCYIKAVYLISESSDAKDDSHHFDLNIVNVTDAEDLIATDVAWDAAGTALTADTPYALIPDQNNQLDALDVLELEIRETGTVSLTECSVIVVYSFDEDDEEA